MSEPAAQPSTPVLVYDGDCGFCRYTVEYAHAVTDDAVTYRSFQDAAADYPEIPLTEFRESIQLMDGDRRYHGAEAAFRTLAIGGRGGWLAWYRHFPGFAAVTEWLYAWVARHRVLCLRVSRVLIGPTLRPARHERTADVVVRGVALCSLAAFASLWWQVVALYGPDGVLPVGDFLDSLAAPLGWARFYYLPSLLWLAHGPAALHTLCAVGTAAALICIAGRLRATMCLVQYACYLSLFHAGQVFLSYQWDAFLLECLVTAAVLARAPTAGIWVARLLLLRFMFLSGFVKLASGDPSWWSGSALSYHFETQPLPNAIAWYAHLLPAWCLTAGTYATLAIELLAPLAIVGPVRLRLAAFWSFLLLEVLIFLTGNYNFFNLLTMVMCVSLLDDGRLWLGRGRRGARGRGDRGREAAPTGAATGAPTGAVTGAPRAGVKTVAAVLIVLGLLQIAYQTRLVRAVWPVLVPAQVLAVANPYGLFAVMTTHRDELVIEGTLDGRSWQPYRFPFKPGDVDRVPGWATPYQPRLDWQMWFAVLNGPERATWIYGLVDALLRANPQVLRLVHDPFHGEAPQAIRISVYRYRFSTPAERAATGAWWVRGERRTWLPPMRLRVPIIRHQPLTL